MGYLTDLILAIVPGESGAQLNTLATCKSATFEVLGQSVLEPEKAEMGRKNAIYEEFAKKHAPLIQQIASLEERIESQEELISKLNEMRSQMNEVLLDKKPSGAE